MPQSQIAVIGSGIVGLTTALEIQQLGHHVTIIAESLPGDGKSAQFTSPWAGAQVGPGPDDDPNTLALGRETFKKFWDLSAEDPDDARYFVRGLQRQYFETNMKGKTGREHMPDFRELNKEELVPNAVYGVVFTTVTVDPGKYLHLLLSRLVAGGGRVCRMHVQHIDQVLRGSWGIPVPEALVVCAGIGARSLGGVEDGDVFPIRGQTVLLHAPWVRDARMMAFEHSLAYVLVRPGGYVLLGGTAEENDWDAYPRPTTSRMIMERALELMPELVPSASVTDLETMVVEHGSGLRPARKGGIRLERGVVQLEGGAGVNAKSVPVVYNYGHGNAGFQLSWGTARVATELLIEGLPSHASK